MNIYSHFSAGSINTIPFPFPRELSMESWIVENKDILKFNPETDDDVEILDWEIPIANGRLKKDGSKGDGRIAILARYGEDVIAVIELKLEVAGKSAKSQLFDYLTQKKEILSYLSTKADYENDFKNKKPSDFSWIGILCAESISPEIISEIESSKEKDELRAISIKRFQNKENGQVYVLTDCYQSKNKTNKNTQKVIFDDDDSKLYGKGKSVFEAVKRYIKKNDPTYNELLNVFPKTLQNSYGVIKQTVEIFPKNDGRYFAEEIPIRGGSYVRVCNQWGIGNIEAFIENANKRGIKMKLL